MRSNKEGSHLGRSLEIAVDCPQNPLSRHHKTGGQIHRVLQGAARERNISPKRKFWGRISRGHPGVIRADIPAQNFGQGAQNPGKKPAFGRAHP